MEIPWQDPSAMTEIELFFSILQRNRPTAFDRVRERAGQIDRIISSLDPLLENLCGLTCPHCTDNCCARATIWYDFKDLLLLYFGPGAFPEKQVRKKRRASGSVCGYLSENGCALPRGSRPFVCTWYICQAQKNHVDYVRIQEQVMLIKQLRQEMEDLFIKAS